MTSRLVLVALALGALGFACSELLRPPGAASHDPPPAVAAVAHAPPSIETCDDACVGCKVLVDSDAKRRQWSRPLDERETALVDTFFLEYLQSPACKADEMHLEPKFVRSSDDASSVQAVVDGSFTKANTKQTLVQFFAGHCGVIGRHFENFGMTFDLLLQDGKLIGASNEGPDGIELQPIDLDRDGFTELVDVTAGFGSATNFQGASVWSYRSGKPTNLDSFDLMSDSCGLPGGEHYEATLLARWDERRNALCFLTKRRDIACPPERP